MIVLSVAESPSSGMERGGGRGWLSPRKRRGDLSLPLRFFYASVTLLLRSLYDNEDPAMLSLR